MSEEVSEEVDVEVSKEIHASQEKLGAALDRARLGEDLDLASQVRDCGERFVRQLFGALRLTRIHDLDNDAFDKPINDLCVSLRQLDEILGAVHLVTVEGQVYVNDVRVRLDERLDTAAQLGAELGRHDVGGVSIHRCLDVVQMKSLIDAFGHEPDSDHPRARLRDRIRDAGIGVVDLVGAYRFRVGDEERSQNQVDQQKVRQRAAGLVDATMDALGSDRMPNPLPVRRSVTELLEGGEYSEGLLNEPSHSTPFARHTLRVTMLALVVGRQLGLPDESLQDLGVTSMFHDVGYAAREGATPATESTPADPGYAPPFERHGTAGARMLLRQRGFHESKVLRALGALHSHWAFDDPRGRPTLFGRILYVCESYDAMTVLGPDTREPPAVLASLQEAARTQYDPVVVQALVNGLGRFPPGTHLKLVDGRRVRVTRLPRGREDWGRPRCKLVHDAQGIPPREPVEVDLFEERVQIAGILSSGRI